MIGMLYFSLEARPMKLPLLRTVVTAERLGRALGVSVRVLPNWGDLIVEIEGTSRTQIVPAKPLRVDMNRVLAVTRVVDRL